MCRDGFNKFCFSRGTSVGYEYCATQFKCKYHSFNNNNELSSLSKTVTLEFLHYSRTFLHVCIYLNKSLEVFICTAGFDITNNKKPFQWRYSVIQKTKLHIFIRDI